MLEIDGTLVGYGEKPYIIAELSANHGGSLDIAKKAISLAKSAGASAVKLQTYTPETMTIESDKADFQITEGPWAGKSLFELYGEAFTPFDWHKGLFDYARSIGISIFSSPFDYSAVELLADLDAPAFKVASFELIDLPLIEAIAEVGKPMFVSTGMGSLHEIGEAVEKIKIRNNNDIVLFHCISSYPAATEEANLNNLSILKKEFDVEVGLSDHTLSNMAAIISLGLGAVAIEKHFKTPETGDGPDSDFSLMPDQFASLVRDCNLAWRSLGGISFARSSSENKNAVFRRSLYFVNDVPSGAVITKNDVRSIRPGFGLAPKFINEVIGKKAAINVERGDPVTAECIKE